MNASGPIPWYRHWCSVATGTFRNAAVSADVHNARPGFSVNFHDEIVLLGHEGDYVMWGPGLDHMWQAETDSVVVTIRWPSLA